MAVRRPMGERARRERVLRAARTSSGLEGARSTEVTRAAQDAHVRGEIDLAELGARVRARYNLA